MLLVLDVRGPDGNLGDMARQVFVEIGLVVDFQHNVAQTVLDGS